MVVSHHAECNIKPNTVWLNLFLAVAQTESASDASLATTSSLTTVADDVATAINTSYDAIEGSEVEEHSSLFPSYPDHVKQAYVCLS